jgi:hypothetical protein
MAGAGARATAAETAGPFPFKAPAPGTVLVYSDGFQIVFGKTTGRVTEALAGPKGSPRVAKIAFQDIFMTRSVSRGRRTLTVKITIDKPGFWPLTLGASRRFRMDVFLDGKPRQSQHGVARVDKSVTALTLAGKRRRVVRVDMDVRWRGRTGTQNRVAIAYFHDLDLGFYVKRSYMRYGAEGRPRTPLIRELATQGRARAGPRK